MRKRMALWAFGLLAVLLLFSWQIQTTDIGYVVEVESARTDAENGATFVISRDLIGGGPEKLAAPLDRELFHRGTYYTIPWLNRLTGTEFETGDLVKVYYTGNMAASAPGQVDGTNLILKLED
ncbi:hypothetical protein [Indiicoccus explosivorum]|uniref:hypothetical protein n=1 Tax=Indiicoccus explosivorum TaxID=1917864 RepID=UPI000B43597B|nr:hypothetical protein [Indiicoccus explosivorum]